MPLDSVKINSRGGNVKRQQHYHHGNLEQALLAEATRTIRESGLEALSMRVLAERVGASRTAAYHYFNNKNALVSAIAESGFQAWEQYFSPLFQQQPIPLKPWLSQFVSQYMTFARDHAEQYDLMFGRPVWKNGEPSDSLKALSSRAFQQYVAFIRTWQAKGVFMQTIDALRLAQVSWGMLHGICRLLNDGVYLEGEAIEGMQEAAVHLLLERSS